MNELAPIVLFVYNRPEHTNRTLQALQRNELAKDSELFIYADAAKDESAKIQVEKVSELISNISGFKRVTIIKQEKNIGLAASIIGGVSKIIDIYGKVIVLEDDLVTSPYFLTFMNSALDFYSEEKGVWHITGWNYPFPRSFEKDVFLWRTMNCWGWATWSDRWSHFEKNTDRLINSFSREEIKKFNLDGSYDFWRQVLDNDSGRINTWAIYWYAVIFKNDGLCLSPSHSLVNNIGNDGSGTNCGSVNHYKTDLSRINHHSFPTSMTEDSEAVDLIMKFYMSIYKSFPARVINRLSRAIIKKDIL